MAKHRIACLPSDGIGKDVVDATMIVLEIGGNASTLEVASK